MFEMAKSSTLSYIRFLARKALKKHNPTIIGIAGSVGKSSTRNAIVAILKDRYNVKSVGNSETGIPLGILGMKPTDYTKLNWAKMLFKAPFNLDHIKNTEYLITEMGIDDPDPPKNMEYLLAILRPDIAISLNVSATHSEQFDKTISYHPDPLPKGEGRYKSSAPSPLREKVGMRGTNDNERLQQVIKKIAGEDTKIITKSGCKIGIYNADDSYITSVILSETKDLDSSAKPQSDKIKLLTFGAKNKNNISYGIYSVDLEGSYFQLFIEHEGTKHELKLKFKTFIIPEEYREVFAAAVLTALQTPIKSGETGLTLNQIKHSLEKNFFLPKSRSTLLHGINNSYIIDSSYNASKQSVFAFLNLLDNLQNKTDKQTVFVLGDMRELGEEAKIEHEEVARRIIGTVDYLYLVGPQTMEYVLPIIQQNEEHFSEVRWFDSAERVGEHLKENMPKEAIVLFKGSQNTIYLEEAVKEILENNEDRKLLCRQTPFWMKQKNKK